MPLNVMDSLKFKFCSHSFLRLSLSAARCSAMFNCVEPILWTKRFLSHAKVSINLISLFVSSRSVEINSNFPFFYVSGL